MSDPTKPKFTRGIRIKPDNLPLENLNGEIKVDSVDNKIKTTLGGSAKEILTNDQVQTLTNKTIDADNNTVSNLEVDNLKAGVLNVNISTGSPTDTQLPSAKAVRDYVDAKTDAQNEASEISFDPAGTIVATNVQDMGEELDGDIQAHINDTVGAHAASAISNTPAGNLAATDVQGALDELQSDVDTRATQTALDNHINDATDAHDASAISVVASGNISSTDAQSALEELQSDIDAINSDIPDFVKGPAVASDDFIPVFSGSTGKLIKPSGAYIDHTNGLLNLPAGTSNLGGTQIIGNKITGIGGALQIEGAGSSGTVYIDKKLSVTNKLTIGGTEDTTSTGSNVTLPNPNAGYIRLKNSGLVSIDMIDATSSNGQKLIIENLTGNPITINNKTGATAANQIVTGSGKPLTLLNEASIELLYDGGTNSKWQVIGGTGSGGGEGIGGADILFAQTFENADLADFTQTGLSLDTASPLHNEVSAKLTHQASVNQSFKQAIPVDPKFRGQINQISLQVKSAASAGNVTLNIYDETNAANILASEQLLLSNDVSGTRNVFSFTVPSTCASLSYTITALPQAGSPVTLVDDIVIQLESVTLVTEALVQESDSVLSAAGNAGQTINAATDNIPFIQTELKGSNISFNGTQITALSSGVYYFEGSVQFTGALARVIQVYRNGTVIKTVSDLQSTTQYYFSVSLNLVAGDVISFRTASNGGTLNNNVQVHWLQATYQGTLKQVNVNPNSKITIPTSELRMEGASTRGSTATAIVRFDNVAKIRGDAFEVVSNAIDGTYVRMKKAGKLAISSNLLAGDVTIQLTKNQTVLTANSTVSSEILSQSSNSTARDKVLTYAGDVNIGDIIRINSSGNPTANISNSLNLSFQEQEIQVSVSNTLPQFSESDSSVRVDTANGYGSTGTRIRRFSNVRDNIGTAIEYVPSAVNGDSFVVKESGIYHISYSEQSNTAQSIGITLNASSLSTNILSLPVVERLAYDSYGAGSAGNASWEGYLQAESVIRATTDGGIPNSNNLVSFTISKVGKPNVTGVDVTPFVNVPMPEVEYLSASGATRVGNGQLTNFTNLVSTNKGILRQTASTITALKNCTVNIAANWVGNSGLQTLVFYVNGNFIQSTNGGGSAGLTATTSINLDLKVGDYVDFYVGNIGGNTLTNASYWVQATATSDHIISPTESFSTDTAQLTYAPSSTYTLATLANAPVGTYITFTYAGSSNTAVQTTVRPTQTDADMNVNGLLVYNRVYTTASTATQPASFAIQIGKGLKGYKVNGFLSAEKVGPCNTELAYVSTLKAGLSNCSYEESTGILYIDGGSASSAATSAGFIHSLNGAVTTTAYLVINASKSPALAGVPALLPRIATLSDVKPSGTPGGTATAGAYQTRTLNTIDDPTGIVTSLAGNQWVLPKGEYYIEASAPIFYADSHKIRLQNISDGVTALTGSTEYAKSGVSPASTISRSFLLGKVVISSPKTFELQHRVSTTRATDGFGVQSGFGDNEVYSVVKITRVR